MAKIQQIILLFTAVYSINYTFIVNTVSAVSLFIITSSILSGKLR